MKKVFCIILFLSKLVSYAQGEANIWYFGQNAGLDFNSGSPVALTNGQINTSEGCAVLSNNLGQLLFYTDGITIYNKNHHLYFRQIRKTTKTTFTIFKRLGWYF